MKLSIVIPVYNEERLIEQTIKRVLHAESCGMEKEIVVIDDGSTDKTVERIKNLEFRIKNEKTKVVTIFQEKNKGKGAALKEAFLHTTGDIVLVQDADLEYDPSDYPILLEPFIKHNADVVYGSRFISNRPHRVLYFWHSVVNTFLTMLSNMFTNLNLTDMETGFKVFKGDLIRSLAPKLQTKRFGFEPEITARIAKVPQVKIYEVGISYAGRTYEEGKKIGWVDAVLAFFQIIYFNILMKLNQ